MRDLRLREVSPVSSLGEEYPKEQARCRELIQIYRDLGPVGTFGLIQIEATLREADEAAISGDVVRMLAAFERMKGCG